MRIMFMKNSRILTYIFIVLSILAIGFGSVARAEESSEVSETTETVTIDSKAELVIGLGVLNGVTYNTIDDDLSKETLNIMLGNIMHNDSGFMVDDYVAEDYVRCSEAVRALVTIMGYSNFAESSGGYPVGYMTQAIRMEMLDGLDFEAGQIITIGDFLRMIYNIKDLEIVQADYSEGSLQYVTKTGDTFLTKIMKYRQVKGQITANHITALNGTEDKTNTNCIAIDGVEYVLSENVQNLTEKIGHYITAYFSEADSNTDDTIIFAQENEKSEVTVINSEDLIGFSGYTISYNIGDSSKTYRKTFRKDAYVIYNGVAVSSYTEDMFNMENGTITLITPPSSSDITTVVVKSYKDVVVGEIYAGKHMVSNSLLDITDENKFLQIPDDERPETTYIYDITGNRATFNDINTGDVLSIAQNGEYMEIYISNTLLRGLSVSSIQEGEQTKVTLSDGNEYIIADALKNSDIFSKLQIRKFYSYTINKFGKIAYIKESVNPSDASGYLVNAYFSSDTGEDKVYVKIFRSDGEMVRLTCADRVTISDTKAKNSTYKNNYEALFNAINSYSGIVWYRLNDAGEIYNISFALDQYSAENPERTYRLNMPLSNDYYVYMETMRAFGFKVYVGGSCIVYSIPMDTSADDEYRILPTSYFTNGNKYHFDGYSSDEDGLYLTQIVLKGQTRTLPVRANGIVVESVSEAVNNDNELYKRVIGWEDGAKVMYDCLDEGGVTAFDRAYNLIEGKDVTYSVQPGDIIRVGYNYNTNIVDDVQIIYRSDMVNPASPDGVRGALVGSTGIYDSSRNDGNPYGYSTDPGGLVSNAALPKSAEFRVFYGWVYAKNGSILTITNQDLSASAYAGETGNYVVDNYNMSSFGKFTSLSRYGGSKYEMKNGTIEDVRAYKDFGSSCSRVIVTLYWGEVNQIILINEEE